VFETKCCYCNLKADSHLCDYKVAPFYQRCDILKPDAIALKENIEGKILFLLEYCVNLPCVSYAIPFRTVQTLARERYNIGSLSSIHTP
jgi:hypothetical protein